MDDLLDTLIEILAEFGLPEPEVNFAIHTSSGEDIQTLLAWPEQQVAVRQGYRTEPMDLHGWRVWECHDQSSARLALRGIADSTGIEALVLRMDFSPVQGLLDAEQYDAAREKIENMESKIQQDHPDWTTCQRFRKTIRIAARKARGAQQPKPPEIPKVSFPGLVYRDAQRMSAPERDCNLLGFFTPVDANCNIVDAVWVVSIHNGQITAWTACVQDKSAYASDTTWETVITEAELLDGVLERLCGADTFVWGAKMQAPLLRNWHYRIKGTHLQGVRLLDMKLIAQVVFPMLHRTDMPEALCKQLELSFCDEMGLGGPVAAMIVLLGHIRQRLSTMPEEQRASLRSILSHGPAAKKGQPRLLIDPSEHDWSLRLPCAWLDFFLPAPNLQGMSGCLELVRDRFDKLPPMILKSDGDRDASEFSAKDFLKAGGWLAQSADFAYRERPEQIGFALRIVDCLTDGAPPHIREAGTGIGKTVGCVIPALLTDKRTIMATHTKALQDQAWVKDIPLVLKAFSQAGIERTVGIIKGKGNYVCLQSVADMVEGLEDHADCAEDCFFLAAVMNWLLETPTGWLSEIEHLGHGQKLRLLGRDIGPPKLRDEWSDIDPHAKARDMAGKVDLLLANHSYVVALANAGDAVRSDVQALIMDEAHNLDAVTTEVLTSHFRPWVLLHELDALLKRDQAGKPRGLFSALLNHAQVQESDHLRRFTRNLGQYEYRLNQWCANVRKRLHDMFPLLHDVDPDYPLAFDAKDFWVVSLHDAAKELHQAISDLAGAAHELLENLSTIKGIPKRMFGSLGAFEEHLNENADALDGLFEARPDWVNWGEARITFDRDGVPVMEGGHPVLILELHSTPLDIAGWLKEHLNILYAHRAYVSATLTIGGNFEPIIQRLGLDAEEDIRKPVTGIYPSPFDYQKQALLAVPHDMPLADPSLKIDPLYMEEQSRHIAELAISSQGRMLVLFTSNLIMREMAPRLQDRLRGQGIIVLTQNDAGRFALVDRLREAPRKGERIVLLGVRSFWEGIDVSGEALSVLVVTRLPFEYHGHPVTRAKKVFYESRGHDRDYFHDKVIPAVFLHLRQMYGRLIRSESDRGVTVITDPRIYIRQYGKYLLQMLPESTTFVEKSPVVVDAVQRFLNGETVDSTYVWGELPMSDYPLSPEQRAILECPSLRILVRATAGSGKTTVLIAKIVQIVQSEQAQPEDVLALTFTNKAMEVMYQRLEGTLGGAKVYPMHQNVLTYHKLAMRIIRQDDRDQKTETGFLDEKNPELQNELFTKARENAGITKETLNDDDARTLISYAQNGLVNEEELQAEIAALKNSEPILAKFALFYLEYVRLLREQRLIDYGEAIVKAVTILRTDKDRMQKWSNRFKWIFCDEYQDTSPAQATLLQLIGQQAHLFVVGDNNQSIYSWQGSDPDNLRRFEIDFPNTASFNLSKNYRCFPKLVRVSTRFLEKAGEARGMRIEYDEKRSSEDQSVYFFHNTTDMEEAKSLAELVHTALSLELPGEPPPEATVGILARKWGLLEPIEIALIRKGIPYKFEGETARGIVSSPRVRDLIKRTSDLLTSHTNGRQFGDSMEGKVGQALAAGTYTTAEELLKAMHEVLPGQVFADADAANFSRLCQLLQTSPLSTIYCLPGADREKAHVVLSTVHSQKGEEFDTVIVIGLEHGNSPHQQPPAHARLVDWRKIVQSLSHATWRAPVSDTDLQAMYDQEEKRIFYVAMTRAKYNLIVSWADERVLFTRKRRYRKSDFLDLASDPHRVAEAASTYDITLSAPAQPKTEEGYRTDGRVYFTNNGSQVRSKSEMLLANEFTARGMYFEYEEPTANHTNALPDFTFPDYGNIILEHLGLLADPAYFEKWQAKAREYEQQGILFLQTNEEEIKHLSATVDRLHDQFLTWSEKTHGSAIAKIITHLEHLRKTTQLNILRAATSFTDGVFDVENLEILAIAICKEDFDDHILSENAATRDCAPRIKKLRNENVNWEMKLFEGKSVWIGYIDKQ